MRWGVAISAALHAGTLCAVGAAWEPPARGARELRVPVTLTSRPGGVLYQPGRPSGSLAAVAARPVRVAPRAARKRPAPVRPSAAPSPAVAAASPSASPSSPASSTGAAALPGPGAPGGELHQLSLLAYLDRVIPLINAHIIYPEEAERLGLEDAFVLRIAVDRGGRLRSARLVGRAPHGLLERSAFAALAASVPLPPPAPELGPLVELDVPFVYRLDGGG